MLVRITGRAMAIPSERQSPCALSAPVATNQNGTVYTQRAKKRSSRKQPHNRTQQLYINMFPCLRTRSRCLRSAQ